jgi:hypothetical protein
MQKALEERGVTVTASVSFTRKDLRDENKVNDLIQRIQNTGAG